MQNSKSLTVIFTGMVIIFTIFAFQNPNITNEKISKGKNMSETKLDTATYGEGCFWCTEAVFERIKGVKSVESGYAGGDVVNPTYEQVSTGTTGHAEVSQITYDPDVVSYKELLEIFFKTHNPTQLNRQGNDVGPQYRSAIFYHNEKQKELAEQAKKELDKAGVYDKKIVTEISPIKNYHKAEDYHQDYYAKNPNAGYCSFVISPKIDKLEEVFKDKLKEKY